ncbi:SET and MYND domain-containing protein 4-like [Contarinia nasturtii]|uniref:SET and MYND domain-containing protein 4-like n=1 Tax=Contarinia nasturtii TaxID=265458 RepID=UPI0012D49018|nr:SET and MYND domain-containing protein 4-like [Contarinia nasturtii]
MKCLIKKSEPQSILWKKCTSEKSDIYIDLFKMKHHVIHLSPIESRLEKAESAMPLKDNRVAKEYREEGKELFAQKKYPNAMKKFNKSLKLAENETEEVGIAYANRSSCFFHMNMLAECMVDLKLARKSNYPDHLIPKLEKRISQCSTLMNNRRSKVHQFDVREPTLSFGEHKKFAGVAECLEIYSDIEYGRHVITNRDLEIGQTILVERPYSIIPTKYIGIGHDRCVHCFKELRNFVACENCISSRFCYDGCMDMSNHSLSCNLPIPKTNSESCQLVLEILFKTNEAFPDIDVLTKTVESLLKGKEPIGLTNAIHRDFCSIFQLTTNHDKRSADQIQKLRNTSAFIFSTLMQIPDFNLKFTKMKHARFLQHLILHFLHISEHAIDLYQYVQRDEKAKLMTCTKKHYASGMYPFGCAMNHSCVPNISWFGINDRLVCKVIRPIKRGAQIFRSYSALEQNPNVIPELDDRYQFKCECFTCSNVIWCQLTSAVNCSQDKLYADAIKPIFMTAQEIRHLPRNQLLSYEQKAIEFLCKYDTIHPVNDTIAIEKTLQILWILLASKFEFASESCTEHKTKAMKN